ncbi:hypothetical protein PRIPAC_81568 [Pristionchus pacificus]|nr:hypothetical protein PRIPAC_81568 [Pristionchus pacificus]
MWFDQVIAERRQALIDEGRMDETVDTGKAKMAFLDLMLHSQEKNSLSDEDIREEVDTFMFEGKYGLNRTARTELYYTQYCTTLVHIAAKNDNFVHSGHDTTSSGMGWTIWLLGQHPEYQAKVHEEMDEVFGDDDREPTDADLKKCVYLEKCIKESLRLCPPVPFFARRLTHDLILDEFTLPKDMTVMMVPIATHRDPGTRVQFDTTKLQYWEHPSEFYPDHFDAEAVAKRHPFAYFPFSAGPRNCIGQKFALAEEKTVLSFFFRKYRVESVTPLPGNRLLPELILKPEEGVLCHLFKRTQFHALSFHHLRSTFLHYYRIRNIMEENQGYQLLESNTLITKSTMYDKLTEWIGYGLLTSTNEKWFNRRKLLTPSFHFNVLKGYQDIFVKQAQIMVEEVESHADTGKEIDLFPYVKRCALDIICETAMSTQLNAQQGKNSEYVDAVTRLSVLLFNYEKSPWLWFKPVWYGCGRGFEFDRLVKLTTDFTRRVIAERRQALVDEGHMDDTVDSIKGKMAFLDLMMMLPEKNALTDEDIRAEVDTFMFEGHDTTSSGLGWTIWLLGQHPEYQAKVHEEMDAVFGDDDREPSEADLKKCVYLEKCIKESLRIRLDEKIEKSWRYSRRQLPRPTIDPTRFENAIKSYGWTTDPDPSKDYALFCTGLKECARAAEVPPVPPPPRLSDRARFWIQERRRCHRDPTSTPFQKIMASRCCRAFLKEDIREYRIRVLTKAAEEKRSIKKAKQSLSRSKAPMDAILDSSGAPITSITGIEERVKEFYTDIFRSETPVPRCPTPPSDDPLPILPSEVRNCIARTKKDGACGPDKITGSMLRFGGHHLHSLLSTRFSRYLQCQQYPTQWKSSNAILIHKKGDRCDLNNYRPISLLSTTYKLFSKVLVTRLETTLDDSQPVEQAGFRRRFGCMDHVHTISALIQHHREYRLPLGLVFVDYCKAFDSVETQAVLNSLIRQGVDSSYVRCLETLNSGCYTEMKPFDRPVRIPIGKGVRQGDTISPKLFTAALQDCMKELDWSEEGILIDGKKLSHLRFADDIVLLGTDTIALERMLKELAETGEKIGLSINRKKTQLMRNEWCAGPGISLGGDPLEETDAYVYLGRELRSDSTMHTELMRRKRAAWAAYGSIREVTRQLQDPKLRSSLFDSHVLPALCYAAETWPLTKSVLYFIQTTHRALERSLIGTNLYTMRQKNMTSSDVRRISLLTDPIDFIRRAKHRWAGHVLRREDDRWSTRVTQWFPPPDLVRPPGRPPARWSDSIEEYAKMPYSTGRSTRSSSLRAPYQHLTTRARDRNTWRDCDPRGPAR